MRISDWSSDVCSSDLHIAPHHVGHVRAPLDDVVGGRRGYRRLFDRLRRLFLVARCQRQHETGNKQDLQYASRDVRGEVFHGAPRSEEHTSELQSLMRISYAVFCLKKKKKEQEQKQQINE